MNASSLDIKDFLIAYTPSLGLIFKGNLFIGFEPETPDNVVTIFDTPGAPADVFFDGTLKYERPSIQFRVRDKSYLNSWAMAWAIKDSLHNKVTEINGTKYKSIICTQEPGLLDWDKNTRARFVLSFDIQRV